MTTKNIHNRHKSVFSLLIAIAMIFSMLPVSAFASDDAQDALTDPDGIVVVSEATGGDDVLILTDDGESGDSGLLLTDGGENGDGLLLTDGSENDPDALLECDCEVRCTEEAINTDCPVCINNPEWCVVGVESPEFEAMDAASEAADLADALNTLASGAASASGPLVSVILPITISTVDEIQVKNGVTLDIYEGGSITVNNSTDSSGNGIDIKAGGILRVQSGGELIVDNSKEYVSNRGIFVNGNLNVMNGGTVAITTSNNANGIVVSTGNMTLYNGSTINIESDTGGNAIVLSAGASPGSVQMYGGTINVKNSAGVGIYVSGNMTFRGGVINVENTGGYGIRVGGNLKLDAADNNVTLTLNGNNKSLETTLAGTVGLNTGTNKATIAVGATAPTSENAPIFRSSPTAAAEAAEANTNYEWSLLTDGTSSGWVVEGATGDTSANYTLYCNAGGQLFKDSLFQNAYEEQTDKWSGSFATLTLHEGFEFETSADTALVMPAATTILVDGDATLTSTNTTADANYGISVGGDLTINVADGKTLTVNVGDGCNVSSGVLAQGTFTKTGGGTLTANGGEAGTVSFGITVSMGGDFTMSGGTINANGGDVDDSGDASYGITTGSGGNFTMTAGTINATGGGGYASMGIRIYNGDFTMSGGTLNATASDAINTSYGIRNTGSFTMSGGAITAIGNLASVGTSCGLSVEGGMSSFSIAPPSAFTMTGGTIIAHSDEASGTLASAMSVYGGVSADGIPVKGLSGSDYTIEASFKEFNSSAPVTPNVIKDSSDNLIYKAKLGTDAPVPSTPSSSGSGKRETPAPAAPVISPMNDKSSGTLSNAINSAANAASSSGKGLDVKLKNVSNFTKENAAEIIKKAKSLGKKATVSSDIMSEDGKYVEVRVTVDPELITKTVRLDGYIRESQTIATGLKFNKHFENKTAVVHLAQEGKFGQTAKIAAKVDLKDFNTANLFIYSYDKKANKYTLITSTNYKIDKNGYLVFNTNLGGDIIISDGQLVKK